MIIVMRKELNKAIFIKIINIVMIIMDRKNIK
jgi:hypothetical protein